MIRNIIWHVYFLPHRSLGWNNFTEIYGKCPDEIVFRCMLIWRSWSLHLGIKLRWSGGEIWTQLIFPLQKTMRISSGKKRPAIPLESAFDQTASDQSKFYQPGASHDTTFTSESRSTASAEATASSDIDFTKLSDEEVRERFRAMMVRLFQSVCTLSSSTYSRTISWKEKKRKWKCLNKHHQHTWRKCSPHIIN